MESPVISLDPTIVIHSSRRTEIPNLFLVEGATGLATEDVMQLIGELR